MDGDSNKRLQRLLDGEWKLSSDGRQLQREFRFNDFHTAFNIMTAIAARAEAMNHHPDWCNSYNRLDIRLTTHSEGKLTDKDLSLAEFIDRVTLET